jgi:hypothetical protein
MNFEGERLYLCPADIYPRHFKKLKDEIVVLDLRATCFLPESFIAYTMRRPAYQFTRKVAKYVYYPESSTSNLEAVSATSG